MDFVRMLLTPVADPAGSVRWRRCRGSCSPGTPVTPTSRWTRPGSGLMGLLMTMLGPDGRVPRARGRRGRLTEALAARLRARGGEIRCGTPRHAAIEVDAGRAVAVEAADGDAGHAPGGPWSPTWSRRMLYGGLVDRTALPARVRRAMRRFQLDPGTVKVDWALDGPVPWPAAPAVRPGTVHVADDVDGHGRRRSGRWRPGGAGATRSCWPGR